MLSEGASNERVGLPMRMPHAGTDDTLVLWPKPRSRQPRGVWLPRGSPGPVANAVTAHMVCGLAEPRNTVFPLGIRVLPLGIRVLPLGGNRLGA